MKGDSVLPSCPRTDAVLAIHLDGDVGGPLSPDESGFDFVCVESLHQHLLDCAICQQQLQRARRLDAALAADAGRATGDAAAMAALEERWLAAIDTAATPVGAGTAAPTTRTAPWLAPAALVAVAAGLCGWLALSALGPSTTVPATATPATAGPPTVSPRSMAEPSAAPIVGGETPGAGTPPEPTAPAAVEVDPAAILIAADAARRAPVRAPRATPSVAALGALCADDGAAPKGRLAAARTLVAMARAPGPDADAAVDALLTALAGAADRTEGNHLLLTDVGALVRAEPRVVGALQRRLARLETADVVLDLPQLAALTVAARLAVKTLDGALQRVLRNHPELADPLAAAVRGGLRRSGTAALLLDAWHDLGSRGAIDDEYGGQRWFAGQAPATFDELIGELSTSASAPRRVHCLLALGFGPVDRVLPVLLERLRSASQSEAHAAAFAISRLPAQALQPLLESAARTDGAGLLRAALARAGVTGSEPWIAALSLGPADRSRLRGGPFRDFPFVAAWFRERPLASHN